MPKVLVQAVVSQSLRRRLDALVRARGCSRSAYVARLLEMHVRAISPRLLRALDELPPESKKVRR